MPRIATPAARNARGLGAHMDNVRRSPSAERGARTGRGAAARSWYNARMIAGKRQEDRSVSADGRRFRVPAWVVVLVIAVVLIVFGIAQGDVVDVWRKASLICYECIGIG